MKKVRFSIVGAGRIALRHAKIISEQAELVAVCDINPDALHRFSAKFPSAKLYSSIKELLAKDKTSQVINICSPSGLHALHTITALRAGRHVVCEKPMALTVKDCKKMLREAKLARRHLFIVKQNRYNPPVKKLKEIIEQGILGKIFSVQVNCFWNRPDRYYMESDWKGTKKLDGGILFTQFSHFIDLLYWLMGDIRTVKAFSKNFHHSKTIDFADTVIAVLKFASGALGTIHCTINAFNKNMEGSITVFGEKGTVKIGGQYLNVLEYQNIENYKIGKIITYRPPNEYGFYRGSMSNHDKVMENVIEVLQGKGKVAVSGSDGLKTVEIIEKIYHQL